VSGVAFKSHGRQSKALEARQRRAMNIIFADSDYEMSLMLAGLDTLDPRRALLTEQRPP